MDPVDRSITDTWLFEFLEKANVKKIAEFGVNERDASLFLMSSFNHVIASPPYNNLDDKNGNNPIFPPIDDFDEYEEEMEMPSYSRMHTYTGGQGMTSTLQTKILEISQRLAYDSKANAIRSFLAELCKEISKLERSEQIQTVLRNFGDDEALKNEFIRKLRLRVVSNAVECDINDAASTTIMCLIDHSTTLSRQDPLFKSLVGDDVHFISYNEADTSASLLGTPLPHLNVQTLEGESVDLKKVVQGAATRGKDVVIACSSTT